MTQATWAILGALAVTNLELAFRSGRHPFGDTKNKALAWWVAIAFLDAGVAVLLVAGVAAVPENVTLPEAGVAAAAIPALLGVLGPLALRSPIRQANIGDRQSAIGDRDYVRL